MTISIEGDRVAAGSPSSEGINGDLESWLALNLPVDGIWAPEGTIAPCPPEPLMYRTSGLTDPFGFASHGVHFLRSLSALSPVPLKDYRAVLDFGIGAGRIARMFHGFQGTYVGVDIDADLVTWLNGHLGHVKAIKTEPCQRLPLADASFDAVISISVFSHLAEADHRFYLSELARVCAPGAVLMLSIHGQRALDRALGEQMIFDMLCIPRPSLEEVERRFADGRCYGFIRQNGHLSSATYDYGITFISQPYIRAEWTRHFDLVDIGTGALHDFQDVVVLRAR